MKLILPRYIEECIAVLNRAGFEAFAVGGCVRDLLLGRVPHDYDITTNALPEDTQALFPRVYETGLRYGTVTVISEENLVCEITTHRTESLYTDNRRPSEVHFCDTLISDLSRRDFTVNAMAYHHKCGLIDHFGGYDDLRQKRIRAVGDPYLRFDEDALRIIRAFRFAAQLNFSIDPMTMEAALSRSGLLENISRERIFHELRKILISPDPATVEALVRSGGFRFLGCSAQNDLTPLKNIPPLPGLRMAAFCLLCGSVPTDFCRELKSDNNLRRSSQRFYEQLTIPLPENAVELKLRFPSLPPEEWEPLLTARLVLYGEDISVLLPIVERVQATREPYLISHLAITGGDLIKIGITDGQKIGKILSELLRIVIQIPAANDAETLLRISQNLITTIE